MDQVFSLPVPDVHTLKVRIWHAVETVTEEVLANTLREIEYRLDVLRATNGAHFEVYPWELYALSYHFKKLRLRI